MKEFMLFQAGNMQMGLELSFVKNVYRNSDLSEILLPEKQDTTLFILDEKEIPVYDFPMILGFKRSDSEAFFQKVMRLEIKGKLFALRVDHVDRVVEVEEYQIEPVPPVIQGKSLKWFPWVLRYEGHLIPILNPEGMAGIDMEIKSESDFFENDEELDVFFSQIIHQETFVNIVMDTLNRVLANLLKKEFVNLKIMLGRGGF